LLAVHIDLKELNTVYQAYIQFNGDTKKAAKALGMKKEEFETLHDKAKKVFNDQAREPKLLFYDSEISEIIGGFYAPLYETHTTYDRVIQDWFIISAQWSWGDGKVESFSVAKNLELYHKHFSTPIKDLKKIPDFDEAVVKKIHALFSEADIIIFHNGDKFDMKKFNARAAQYGLDPIPETKTIDTLKIARKYFSFTSNKLGDLCEILNVKYRKLSPRQGDFFAAATGDISAVKRIEKYGKGDIPTLRDIYKKLRPYAKTHPNMNLYCNTECNCPKCSSPNLEKRGERYLANSRVQRYKCKDCGSWSSATTALKITRPKVK